MILESNHDALPPPLSFSVTGRSIMDNEQERFGFLRTIEKYATQFLKVRSRVIVITIFTVPPINPTACTPAVTSSHCCIVFPRR